MPRPNPPDPEALDALLTQLAEKILAEARRAQSEPQQASAPSPAAAEA